MSPDTAAEEEAAQAQQEDHTLLSKFNTKEMDPKMLKLLLYLKKSDQFSV